jgi:hypothetical protein
LFNCAPHDKILNGCICGSLSSSPPRSGFLSQQAAVGDGRTTEPARVFAASHFPAGGELTLSVFKTHQGGESCCLPRMLSKGNNVAPKQGYNLILHPPKRRHLVRRVLLRGRRHAGQGDERHRR